jgi:hypothetical protein
VIVAGVILIFYVSDKTNNQTPSISGIHTQVISDQINTYTTDYFQFQDTSKWILDKTSSTASKYHYLKYKGQTPQEQLVIYVDHEPSSDLPVNRVLPVRIASNNTLKITSISDSCGNQYAKGELIDYKNITINGVSMYCFPDDPLYSVVIGEIGGNYNLTFHRHNGSYVKLVIIYRNMALSPNSTSLLKIANSFKVL